MKFNMEADYFADGRGECWGGAVGKIDVDVLVQSTPRHRLAADLVSDWLEQSCLKEKV